MRISVDQLEPYMLVDLEGDEFADPNGNPTFEFEYAVVDEIEYGTLGGKPAVIVHFDACTVAFPSGHEVEIDTGAIR